MALPQRNRYDTDFPSSISMKLDQLQGNALRRELDEQGDGESHGHLEADEEEIELEEGDDEDDMSSISSFEEEDAEWKKQLEKAVKWLPSLQIIDTIKQYHSRPDKWSVLLEDFITAIILTVMVIPQGMAYATLAGMPPKFGLVSSVLASLTYGLFGTSRHLVVGPVAIISLLTSETLEREGFTPLTDEYVTAALRLAFFTGVLNIFLGLIHAGEIASFLSSSVVKGFITAACIVIGSTQLGSLLGVTGEKDNAVYNVWISVFSKVEDANPATIYLAIENMILLFGLKYLKKCLGQHFQKKQQIRDSDKAKKYRKYALAAKAFPHTLVVVILNIIFVIGFNLDNEGVKIVGKLERGWVTPENIFGDGFGDMLANTLPGVLIITIIGFLESISSAKVIALKFGYSVDSTQELMGLGIANIVAPLGLFPSTGSLSRTSVNAETGGQTQMSSILSGGLLAIVVFSILPWFESLPEVTLACIIIVAVIGMADTHTPFQLWKTDKADFMVWLATFVLTLTLGVEAGILFGTLLSVIFVLKVSARPHYAIIGRVKQEGGGFIDNSDPIYRNVIHYGDVTVEDPHVRIIRFDSQLFFANSEFFQEKVSDLALPEMDLSHHKIAREAPQGVMVDMGSIAAIDATSLDTLFDLPAVIEKKCIGFRYWTLRQLNRQIKKAEIENRKMFEQHDDDERQVHLRRIQTHIDAIDALRERFRMELSKLQAGKFQLPIVALVNVRSPILTKLRRFRHIKGVRPTKPSRKRGRTRGSSSFRQVRANSSRKRTGSRKFSENDAERQPSTKDDSLIASSDHAEEVPSEKSEQEGIAPTSSVMMMRACSTVFSGSQHVTLYRHRSSRVIILMDREVETSLDVHQGAVELHNLFNWPLERNCETDFPMKGEGTSNRDSRNSHGVVNEDFKLHGTNIDKRGMPHGLVADAED